MISAAATGDLVNHLFLTVIVNMIVNIYVNVDSSVNVNVNHSYLTMIVNVFVNIDLNVNVNHSDLKMMTASRALVLARMKSSTMLFSIL